MDYQTINVTVEQVHSAVKCYLAEDLIEIIKYELTQASDKMLGFLSEYWRLEVLVKIKDEIRDVVFFVKGVSRTNSAKAAAVRELKLFNKELFFYTVIKKNIDIKGIKPWSAKLVGVLDEAYIFEDLSYLGYKNRHKLNTFDTEHTLRALETVARFHSLTIIHEERQCNILGKPYSVNDEFGKYLDRGSYYENDPWFKQCMIGSLQTIKRFSKYASSREAMDIIENKWNNIWISALRLSDASNVYRNVISHRDLWSNNILFRYNDIDDVPKPVDCVLVDFQAVRYQPPAGDVMLLLYCNLETKVREENMEYFLNYYYEQLSKNLNDANISADAVLPKNKFIASAEQQRQWALVVFSCLLPQFWIDDDVTTKLFSDSEQFQKILSEDKSSFIRRMMDIDDNNYKRKVLGLFEEIVERYCLPANLI